MPTSTELGDGALFSLERTGPEVLLFFGDPSGRHFFCPSSGQKNARISGLNIFVFFSGSGPEIQRTVVPLTQCFVAFVISPESGSPPL